MSYRPAGTVLTDRLFAVPLDHRRPGGEQIEVFAREVQADYLTCFRADSIVLDAELIRRELIGSEPWSVLGQSFGGFCVTSYLSFAPDGLREALLQRQVRAP
jgi:hypothetical protein